VFFRKFRPAYSDGVIDLVSIRLYPPDSDMGFGECYDYIIAPHGQSREAGRISLRLGESPCVYYFGHIGYHVDPPYRGQHYARRACALLAELMRQRGKTSVVITTDPDNIPSRRTCEGLGCEMERIVDVPREIRSRWEISAVKCRYIWRLDE
jgi:predicted acetyltransferase